MFFVRLALQLALLFLSAVGCALAPAVSCALLPVVGCALLPAVGLCSSACCWLCSSATLFRSRRSSTRRRPSSSRLFRSLLAVMLSLFCLLASLPPASPCGSFTAPRFA